MKIVLLEDRAQSAKSLLHELKLALRGRGTAVLFEASGPPAHTRIHEEQLEHDLLLARHGDAALIVADRDLSGLPHYGGLSEPTVRRVADKLAIPECGYARGENSKNFMEDAALREGRIAVSLKPSAKEFARQVVSIAEGFAYILSKLPAAIKAPGSKSPGKVLATILGKPEYSEKIALYASGDQNRLVSVLRVRGQGKVANRHLACLLGYWLWDSVLRYPGIVVNETAASSYLNIDKKAFQSPGVQQLFNKASYNGPFSAAKRPIWWRGALDDIVAKSGASDGRQYATKLLGKNLPQSKCCVDPKKTAGYYCMLSEEPVSLDNSKAGLAWFPRGADLARIGTTKYQEIVPWL
ncbi:MAG TPA: hypothetical protein VMU69_20170 [Bradyrhizobium sp.]|nr:hypothetical protein [Bradyrhizobium sp.]